MCYLQSESLYCLYIVLCCSETIKLRLTRQAHKSLPRPSLMGGGVMVFCSTCVGKLSDKASSVRVMQI